ncbi:MAG: DUF2442 domain-containing protein [Chthoniobacterales bacterium]
MKIVLAKALANFRLHLRFADGVEGDVDLSPLAGKGVFTAWSQSGLFEKVNVTDYGTVEWPGDLDLCPDTLYMQLTGKRPADLFPSLRTAHA